MTTGDLRTTRQLFKEWRSGDAEAGQAMAQRVADWYYAIATSRLGERRGRGPCERACAAFGAGIVGVTDSRQLVSWAHELVEEEIRNAGTRATDGDDPSAYTGRKRPKALLAQARSALPDEMRLLEVVYGADADRSQIDQLAAPLGGNPMGILKSRYAVKRWLRDQGGISFEVAPLEPILDRAPVPLYEADRMASTAEEAQFEHWMLTDLDLCKDIAEFAHFSIALRGGIPELAPAAARADMISDLPDDSPDHAPPADAPARKGSGMIIPILIGAVVLIVIALGVAAAIAMGALAMFTG
jgi:hypothetical protein